MATQRFRRLHAASRKTLIAWTIVAPVGVGSQNTANAQGSRLVVDCNHVGVDDLAIGAPMGWALALASAMRSSRRCNSPRPIPFQGVEARTRFRMT
jgi:hypothetical protein